MIGAIIGDICGSPYEWDPLKDEKAIRLDHDANTFTDDTVCTLAIYESLKTGRPADEALRDLCTEHFTRGYGLNFLGWISESSKGPYGSWGNGAAMRVSPAAYLSTSIKNTAELARQTALVTHDHWQGLRGAQATAVATRMALEGHSKKEIKATIERAYGYDLSRKLDDIRPSYSFDVSCQGSVPESIIAFLESSDYEDCIRKAISLGGDADTMACIAGGIAGAYYGVIPSDLMALMRDRLTPDLLERLDDFNAYFHGLPSEALARTAPEELPDWIPPPKPPLSFNSDDERERYEHEMDRLNKLMSSAAEDAQRPSIFKAIARIIGR